MKCGPAEKTQNNVVLDGDSIFWRGSTFKSYHFAAFLKITSKALWESYVFSWHTHTHTHTHTLLQTNTAAPCCRSAHFPPPPLPSVWKKGMPTRPHPKAEREDWNQMNGARVQAASPGPYFPPQSLIKKRGTALAGPRRLLPPRRRTFDSLWQHGGEKETGRRSPTSVYAIGSHFPRRGFQGSGTVSKVTLTKDKLQSSIEKLLWLNLIRHLPLHVYLLRGVQGLRMCRVGRYTVKLLNDMLEEMRAICENCGALLASHRSQILCGVW